MLHLEIRDGCASLGVILLMPPKLTKAKPHLLVSMDVPFSQHLGAFQELLASSVPIIFMEEGRDRV